MTTRTWFITGVNSGFGREMSRQLLERGDRVAGTVRRDGSADDLLKEHGDRFTVSRLDLTDTARIRPVVDEVFARLGRVDVVINNAGYGLFGAAEELTDAQVEHQIATNLLGTIQATRAALPHLRAQGGGRLIQMSSVAGLAAHAGASLYHASKWGLEGFSEALAQEVAPFGIEVTLVEPGGARTAFATTSLQVGTPLADYGNAPSAMVHGIKGHGDLLPGDPAKVAAAVIASAEQSPAPRRVVLGSDSYQGVTAALRARLAEIEPQKASAAATDA
ncbi:SDR family oxidoreductase [Catenuloplanes sp. NPDC051500]|uniref:SDR family oxidoreductase n=1 Tax=Catenuloplanes sp. NPDC051500 TaxID=3363959 RepID=UPI0037B8FFFC